ncbi:hypothetical protein [Brevundimonas sp.]|uniref:hypothetical protein n=1 Tax=Brevundimonas sp. TaxID=1871086 RepID=UPI0035B02185
MFETIYSQAVAAAAVVVVAFAFTKGDEPERIGAGAYAMVYLASLMIPEPGSLSTPRWGIIALDVVLLIVFVGIGWSGRRAWAVWAASFQGLIVAGHVLVIANLRPPQNAVAAVINMSNYGLLIALAVGTFWAWQERRAARLAEQPGPHL